ncbi:DUF3017 domain-containing protein [Streptomyces sp. NPDC012600]|uniref:DUF3017 domain-containing protein n=1 Tax=Kitasatospora albolonga TaxID=68173 RepID=A0ABC8BW87_9ACTN|nr:hypothetical protein B7C62_22715 [Kitasatospora albolonga]
MGAGTSPADPAPDPVPAGRGADGPDPVEEESGAASTAAVTAATGSTAATTAEGSAGSAGSGSTASAPAGQAPARRRSRRFPLFTRDTARPEGGGRAAPGDAPAPARQWPLLTVLCAAGAGLLIVAMDPFDQAFRIGTILIGAALIAGAVLRWVVPSVGMLAVRSRFTDLVTYGLMGTLIVLLALVAQPKPWLDVPILEDAVRFTIR